jgi:hypothetical protein
MLAHRINMRTIKEVLRLKFDGDFSHNRIAASLGIFNGVMTMCLGCADATQLDWSSAGDIARVRHACSPSQANRPAHAKPPKPVTFTEICSYSSRIF